MGLTGLLVALRQIPSWGAASPATVGCFVVAALSLGTLVRVESRRAGVGVGSPCPRRTRRGCARWTTAGPVSASLRTPVSRAVPARGGALWLSGVGGGSVVPGLGAAGADRLLSDAALPPAQPVGPVVREVFRRATAAGLAEGFASVMFWLACSRRPRSRCVSC